MQTLYERVVLDNAVALILNEVKKRTPPTVAFEGTVNIEGTRAPRSEVLLVLEIDNAPPNLTTMPQVNPAGFIMRRGDIGKSHYYIT